MGKSMVRNLMKHGFEVSIYARTKAKVEDVLNDGALWCDTIAHCATGRDAVITMVGYPKDVRGSLLWPKAHLAKATQGCVLIDMTTTSPQRGKNRSSGKERLKSSGRPGIRRRCWCKNGLLTHHGGRRKKTMNNAPIFQAMGSTI